MRSISLQTLVIAAASLFPLGLAAARPASTLASGPNAPSVAAAASPAAAGKPIARIWRGRTLASKADEYEAYLFASGITKVRETPGNRGVTVLRREDGNETEFQVISIWDSLDAIQRFAGKDYEKAVILDRDREYLLEVEPTVRHYSIEKEERSR
jgi:heme-degrading monooxygenase HmoA